MRNKKYIFPVIAASLVAVLLVGVAVWNLILIFSDRPTTGIAETPAIMTETFQQLAVHGPSVYSNNCASCHGDNGQGKTAPALWGPWSALGQYGTTPQALLNYISSSMPLSAPASLSHEQYLNLMGYILLQNNQVSPADIFSDSQTGSAGQK